MVVMVLMTKEDLARCGAEKAKRFKLALLAANSGTQGSPARPRHSGASDPVQVLSSRNDNEKSSP